MYFDVTQHEWDRSNFKWGSHGKNGDEPLTKRFLKDISTNHLENIIRFINEFIEFYSADTIRLMNREWDYRVEKFIFVPDYDTSKRKSFIRRLK